MFYSNIGRSISKSDPQRRADHQGVPMALLLCPNASCANCSCHRSNQNVPPAVESKCTTRGRLDLVFQDRVSKFCFGFFFVYTFGAVGGDRALQKCNLSNQCARGLVESIPRPSLLGRVLFFLDALQTRLKAKNSSFLVGSAAILFFLLSLHW